MSFSDLLDSVVSIAKQAGTAVMRVHEDQDLEVTEKSDVSPLTRADIESHHLILAGLQQLPVKLPVLSEESRSVPYEVRKAWSSYWLVDPLDGTKEFINRNGEFTVNIALISGQSPIVGVVHAPALALSYFAAKGQGAFKQKADDAPIKITVNPGHRDTLRIVASRSHRGAKLDEFLEKIGQHECVSMGSSLKFCLIAEGTACLYPRLGPTMEWDTAAGQCIVESAGGKVTTLQGDALCYNKPDLLNPDFLVSADSAFRWHEQFENKKENFR